MSWVRRASPTRSGGRTQELAVFAANCSCLHLLAAMGCRTGKKGSFFAANFTSCHVIACICTYIHINFFSGMNHRGTILGCFGVLQRISGYSAYFSLNIYFQNRTNHKAQSSKRSEQSFSQLFLLPSVEVRPRSQPIPMYSSLSQRILFQNRSHE